jgi:hypothetical protein
MKRYCDGSIRLTWPQTLRPSTKYAFHGWNNLSARPNINNNRQLNHPSLWMGPSSWLGPSPLVKPRRLVVVILEEAASVWRLLHLSQTALAAWPHAKAAKGFLDGLPLRCVAFAWRCAASSSVERSPAYLAVGRTASKALCALPVCRANDPR